VLYQCMSSYMSSYLSSILAYIIIYVNDARACYTSDRHSFGVCQ
jgi:hypothetical protein